MQIAVSSWVKSDFRESDFDEVNRLDATGRQTCIKPVKFTTLTFLAVFSKKINQSERCTHIHPPPKNQFYLKWLVSPAILHSTLIDLYVFFPLFSTSALF